MQSQSVRQPLVATKLFVPRLRPNRVDRARLRERIDGSRHTVLVSAPAGSGKSTLLAEWVAACGDRVAWLSLDRGDDEPRRFVNYVLAALRKAEIVGWSEVEASRAAEPGLLQATLAEVLNEIAASEARANLILDDYHVIQSVAIHDLLQYTLDHLPPNLRLIISTRADPPLALSRLRARDSLTEIRAADLRFSVDEAGEFLNRSMGLQLGDHDVAELERRTEGWAVGLQMAAISLRGRQKPDDFISDFTGSNRYVLDYLTDEVIAGQPPDVRDFLIQTSILGRLSAPLCDAITGREDSGAILQTLDVSNLFVTSLDDVRFWYRYHHLFGTLLQHHLERTLQADAIRALHLRASDWLAEHGFLDEAIDHAVTGGDLDRVRTTVSENGVRILLEGDYATVGRWLRALPEGDLWNRADLLAFQAAMSIGTLHLDLAERCLARAEELLDDSSPRKVQATVLAIRGIHLRSSMRIPEAVEAFERAYEFAEPGTPLATDVIAFELAMNALASADLVRADELLTMHRSTDDIPPRNSTVALSQSIRAEAKFLRGEPDEAESLARKLIEWAEQWDSQDRRGAALSSCAYAVLSDIYRSRNDLTSARAFAEQGLDIGRRGWQIGELQSTLSLILVAAAERKWDEVDQLMDHLTRTMTSIHMIWVPATRWIDYRIALRRSDVDRAAAAVAHEGLDTPPFRVRERMLPGFFASEAFLVAARVMLHQGRTAVAIELLDELIEINRQRDCVFTLIEALILRAIASGSADTMREAMELATRPRFVRPFVDEGAAASTLIERAAPRIRDRGFANQVLGALDVKTSLSEILSEREIEVLRLIADGASNQDAGRKLFISPSTVKKHLENIYSKLDVGGRTQAIARARELGLL